MGITITTHYCGGKLASVSVNLLDTEKCACGSKKMKKDCCKTTTCTFSIKEVQQKNVEYTFGCSNNFKILPVFIPFCIIGNFGGLRCVQLTA